MSDKTPQEIFARLLAISAIQEAQIKANPLPFLNKIAKGNYHLRVAIENAIMALSGADDLDLARQIAPNMNPSIVQTALARNSKAADILRRALEDKHSG